MNPKRFDSKNTDQKRMEHWAENTNLTKFLYDAMTSFLTISVSHHFHNCILVFLKETPATNRHHVPKQALHLGHKIWVNFAVEIQQIGFRVKLTYRQTSKFIRLFKEPRKL